MPLNCNNDFSMASLGSEGIPLPFQEMPNVHIRICLIDNTAQHNARQAQGGLLHHGIRTRAVMQI